MAETNYLFLPLIYFLCIAWFFLVTKCAPSGTAAPVMYPSIASLSQVVKSDEQIRGLNNLVFRRLIVCSTVVLSIVVSFSSGGRAPCQSLIPLFVQGLWTNFSMVWFRASNVALFTLQAWEVWAEEDLGCDFTCVVSCWPSCKNAWIFLHIVH